MYIDAVMKEVRMGLGRMGVSFFLKGERERRDMIGLIGKNYGK